MMSDVEADSRRDKKNSRFYFFTLLSVDKLNKFIMTVEKQKRVW